MSTPSLLDALNAEQRQAVFAPQGPLLVLAGAGSGKTRVLTGRIVHSIQCGYARAGQILALTFTNKAAGEMAQRCAAALPPGSKKPFLGTFHSFGLRLLRRHADQLGYRRDFVLADYGDQLGLVRELLQGQEQEVFDNPKQALAALQHAKSQGLSPQALEKHAASAQQMAVAQLWRGYQDTLQRWGAMDFEDLLQLSLRLTEEAPQAARQFFARYRCVLVDECQDTNPVQFALLKALVVAHGNLFAVGDDDQSIYGWRGAAPQNLLDFEEHFPGGQVLRLQRNYRSTEPILQAANAVIAHNRARRGKTLIAHRQGGRGLGWLQADTEEQELAGMVERMRLLHLQEGVEWGGMAVLLRANHQTRLVEEALREEGLPYRLMGGVRFYDRKEVKDVLAHLRIIAQPQDQMSLVRALQFPRRGVGRTALNLLLEGAAKQDVPPAALLRQVDSIRELPAAAARSLFRYGQLLERFRPRFAPGRLHLALADLLAELDFTSAAEQERSSKQGAEKARELIQELQRSVEQFVERNPQAGLERYLERIALMTLPQEHSEEATPREITLLTIHAAKGLEFPCVFLPQLVEGSFPHQRSIQAGQAGLEEERRLFYVALTRAQRLLNLSAARFHRRFKERIPQQISRFALEIPPPLFAGRAPNGQEDPTRRKERTQAAKARFFAQLQQRQSR